MRYSTGQLVTKLATPHQRLYVRTLMEQLDLDVSYVTLMHGRFFVGARIPKPEQGSRIDAVLCALTWAQASALITVLKKEVPDD